MNKKLKNQTVLEEPSDLVLETSIVNLEEVPEDNPSVIGRILSSDLCDERVNKIKINKNHIYFYCDISQDSCLELVETIESLINTYYKINYEDYRNEKLGKSRDIIHLHINSLGGEVYSSLYLHDYLLRIQKKHKCVLYTYAEGIVASGATLLYLAGEKRFITKNSFFMMHLLSQLIFGKHNELNNVVLLNNIIMDKIYLIYMKFMNVTKKKLKKMLLKDTYLDYTKCAKKYNISTDILE